MDEIQEVKKLKINLEETIKTLRPSLMNEAVVSDTDHSNAVKATLFAKTLIEKEKTLKDLIMVQGKLEDEYKAL